MILKLLHNNGLFISQHLFNIDAGDGKPGGSNQGEVSNTVNSLDDDVSGISNSEGNASKQESEGIELPAGKGKKITLPAEQDGISVRKVLDHHMASARKQGAEESRQKYDELIEKLSTLETKNKDLVELVQKHEDEKLTADERAKRNYERQIQVLQTEISGLTESVGSYKNRYESERINNELFRALSKYDIYNMNQAKKLLRSDGKAALVEDKDGNDKVVLRLEVDGLEEDYSPTDAVKLWLERPDNTHHIKANLRSGSGVTGYGNAVDAKGARVFTLDQWTKMVSEAKPEERQQLIRERASGRIAINNG